MSTHTIDLTNIEPLPKTVALQKALEALEAAEVDLYPRDVQPTNIVRNRIRCAAFALRAHLAWEKCDAAELLATLHQINDWCCYATEEDTAARLMALQQIGVHARAAIARAVVPPNAF